MKYLLCLFLFGLAFAQDAKEAEDKDSKTPEGVSVDVTEEGKQGSPQPRIYRRMIPADNLRDFPNYCFASTSCKLYEPGQDWDLAPFCGRSHCMFDPETRKYLEVVFDCGPKPTNPETCKIIKAADASASFPACCDVYDLDTCEFPIPKVNNQGAPGNAPSGNLQVAGRPEEEPEAGQEEAQRRPQRRRQ